MKTDVLIVGGGLSGLALADHLSRAGVDFLLVEALDRFGGRILTVDLSGGKFDLGPAWFWPEQPRMDALVRRFDIPVFEQFSTGDLMYQAASGAVQRGRGYASMQGAYRLEGGMGRLIDALSGALDPERLLLDAVLQSLSLNEAHVTAQLIWHGEPAKVQAGHVVLALPPRVVADTITFEPALEAAQLGAMENIPTWMAGQAKIVAVYDQPHWRDAGLSGDAMSQCGPMVEIHDASPANCGPFALFGFVGVPADARVAHKDAMMRLALAQLIAMFGPEMGNPVNLVLQDWAAVPEVARSQDRAALTGHPSYGLPLVLRGIWPNKLQLASTETAQTFGGFLEGALEAAERASEILAVSISTAADRGVSGPLGHA